MGSVTGFTAARMKQISDKTVASMAIVSNHLIVTRTDGTTFDAGILPAGPTGPSGGVSESTMNASILVAINAFGNNSGKGIIAQDVSGTHSSWTFEEDNWKEVPGLSLTFTPSPGRVYRFGFFVPLKSEEANTEFDIELREGGSGVITGASGYKATPNRTIRLNGSGDIVAPSGWNVSKTFKMYARFSTNYEVHVEADVIKARMSVEDIGVI